MILQRSHGLNSQVLGLPDGCRTVGTYRKQTADLQHGALKASVRCLPVDKLHVSPCILRTVSHQMIATRQSARTVAHSVMLSRWHQEKLWMASASPLYLNSPTTLASVSASVRPWLYRRRQRAHSAMAICPGHGCLHRPRKDGRISTWRLTRSASHDTDRVIDANEIFLYSSTTTT